MKILSTALLILAAPTLAFAVDLGPDAATSGMAVQQSSTAQWTGAYAGIQATNFDATVNAVSSGVDAFRFSGTKLGFHAGYLHDFGKVVLGGEVTADLGSTDWTLATTGATQPFSTDTVSSVRLKAGYDLGKALVYATAGRVHMVVKDTSGLSGTDPRSANGTLYGIGLAYKLREHLMGSAEILKMNFDPFKGASGFDSQATAFSLRLSYRF